MDPQRQLSLAPSLRPRTKHGGEHAKGRRKLFRPLATRRPLHLSFKSSRARESWSLLRPENAEHVAKILNSTGKRFHVRILESANVGNHLHLVIQGKTLVGIRNFLRTVAAQIATRVTKARKGSPKGKFWDALVFSRVVAWGRDFREVCAYVYDNHLEGAGLWYFMRKYGGKPPGYRVYQRPRGLESPT